MTTHGFNAVRLPLTVSAIHDNAKLESGRQIFKDHCDGHMLGHRYLDNVESLVQKLGKKGIFVMLDMHELWTNDGHHLWCKNRDAGCEAGEAGVWDNFGSEQNVRIAWATLTSRFCAKHRNVIIADLYNEPASAHWAEEGEPAGLDWRAFATRLGDQVLGACPRWLVAVQGIGSGPECTAAAGDACWWGENVLGELRAPIQLALPCASFTFAQCRDQECLRALMAT